MTDTSLSLTLKQINDVFSWGVDYGQFLMEQERDGEYAADVLGCWAYSQKYCMPSAPVERRQPHSQKWREIKGAGIVNYVKLLAALINNERD